MIHRYLEQFKAIAETNSMRQASEALHVSQPALSRSIKILEDLMDTQLFTRKNKGIELNEYGKILYQQVCSMDKDFMYAVNEIEFKKRNKARELKLGAGFVWQYSIFPEVFSRYNDSFPDVNISLVTGYSQRLYKQFLEGEFDIIFCDLDPLEQIKGVVFKHMFDVHFSFFAAESHPIFTEPSITKDDLPSYDLAMFSHSNRADIGATQHMSANLLKHIKFTSGSIYNLLAVVSTTHYITTLPLEITAYAAQFGIREINPEFRINPFPSGVIYRENSIIQDHIHGFLDLTQQQVDTLQMGIL